MRRSAQRAQQESNLQPGFGAGALPVSCALEALHFHAGLLPCSASVLASSGRADHPAAKDFRCPPLVYDVVTQTTYQLVCSSVKLVCEIGLRINKTRGQAVISARITHPTTRTLV